MKLFRRSILSIFVLLLLAGSAFGAAFTAVASGDWTSNATWGTAAGAVEGTNYPGPNDTVDLAAYVVALNQTTIPTTGSLGAITASGAGRMTVALQTAGTCRTFSCTTMTAGSCGTNGLLQTAGTTGNSFTLNATTINGGATANNICVFRNETGAGTYTINCTAINGGSAATAYGVRNYNAGPMVVNVTGDITGGSATNAHAIIHSVSNGVLTINGGGSNLLKGGSVAVCYGLAGQGTANITVNDMVITGGTFLGSSGINQATGSYVLHGCSIDNGTTTVALSGIPPTMTSDANDTLLLGGQTFAVVPSAANVKKGVVVGSVTGTFVPTHGIL